MDYWTGLQWAQAQDPWPLRHWVCAQWSLTVELKYTAWPNQWLTNKKSGVRIPFHPAALVLTNFMEYTNYPFSFVAPILSKPFLSSLLSLSEPRPSALCAPACAWAPMRSPVEVIVCYHSGFSVLSAHCTYLFSSAQSHCACVPQRKRRSKKSLVFSYIMDVNSVPLSLRTWCLKHNSILSKLDDDTLCYRLFLHFFISWLHFLFDAVRRTSTA